MPFKSLLLCILAFILSFTHTAQADIRLNWQVLGQSEFSNIAITYKDKDHIIISAPADVKLLKIKTNLYLLQTFKGFKVAFNLSKFRSKIFQRHILKMLPKTRAKFLPVMVIDGSKRIIQGYEGNAVLLKDYKKSVLVISSLDSQHIAIKNALMPMLVQLVKRLPDLPNRQLIEVLKHHEFGLPLQIGNELILTQSETVNAHKNTYSLKGYKVISSLNDLVF